MENNIIQLTSESGTNDFELIMVFESEGGEYAALSDINDEESVIIMKMIKEGDEYIFETIEDETKAQELFVEFMAEWEADE